MLNVTKVGEYLGIKVAGEFIIDELGIEPDGRDKRSIMWTEDSIKNKIIPALRRHLDKVYNGQYTAVASTPRKKTVAADPFAL